MRGGGSGRLRRREVDHVFAVGRTLPDDLVVLRVAPGPDRRASARVAVAVGRRVGSAVVRNRVRRRWREVVRLGPPLAQGWDVVVMVRGAGAGVPAGRMRESWAATVRRRKLLAPPTAGGTRDG